MLSHLSIQNFTLISELEIDFPNGLNIITGETGAGKSIILGALKLVLGERVDYSIFHEKTKKCIIEATFQLNNSYQKFFEENDLDYDESSIFRREINPDGKSRSFINDVPVTLNILQELSKTLIDIHSQFQNENLFQPEFQFNLLDNFAGISSQVVAFKKEFTLFNFQTSELAATQEKYRQSVQNQDYNSFLFEELEALQLEKLNIENLENEYQELNNVENLQENFSQLVSLISDENIGLNSQITEFQSLTYKIIQKSTSLESLSERIKSMVLEYEDVVSELEQYSANLEFNPEKIAAISDKINLIQNLYNKHHVNSIEELLVIKNQLDNDQLEFSELQEKIKKLELSIAQKQTELTQKSTDIHSERIKFIPKLEHYIQELFTELGLEKAQIKIHLVETETFNENGKNAIEFLFSANTGIPLQPIAKAISGGERSRVMFAIKKVMAENEQLSTLILDEIDTGVSGKIAFSIGNLMEKMSANRQLIVITHLPQIASKGNHHFKVVKFEEKGTTHTHLTALNSEERITELAQLISGESISEASILQAKELLK